MKFEIDEEYLTSVTVHKEWSMYRNKDTLTNKELIKVLKGEDRCSTTHCEDHPTFTELREKLGEQGYIKIERGWWNGDRVLRPFRLNGIRFSKGDQFSCAAALKISFTIKRKHNGKGNKGV